MGTNQTQFASFVEPNYLKEEVLSLQRQGFRIVQVMMFPKENRCAVIHEIPMDYAILQQFKTTVETIAEGVRLLTKSNPRVTELLEQEKKETIEKQIKEKRSKVSYKDNEVDFVTNVNFEDEEFAREYTCFVTWGNNRHYINYDCPSCSKKKQCEECIRGILRK